MTKPARPSGLFSIEEVDSVSAGYPKELDGCDLCEHCRLRRNGPPADLRRPAMKPLPMDRARR